MARGGHSSTILHDHEPTLLKTLYGVDPFLAYYDDLDIFAQKRQAEFDAMHDFVRQRLADEEAARPASKCWVVPHVMFGNNTNWEGETTASKRRGWCRRFQEKAWS